VRLTEKFVADATRPFAPGAGANIAAHTREVFSKSALRFSLPAGAGVVGTGGTLATVRAVLGARIGKTFEQTDPLITLAHLRELVASLGGLSLAERKKISGLPPARADVFPTALATLIAVAEFGGFGGYENSLYNLRFGLAAEALDRAAD
jgi:exopolyphosphatase/guanosine-5'-triphosphate,3'-diphosphate pyrophosphatase